MERFVQLYDEWLLEQNNEYEAEITNPKKNKGELYEVRFAEALVKVTQETFGDIVTYVDEAKNFLMPNEIKSNDSMYNSAYKFINANKDVIFQYVDVENLKNMFVVHCGGANSKLNIFIRDVNKKYTVKSYDAKPIGEKIADVKIICSYEEIEKPDMAILDKLENKNKDSNNIPLNDVIYISVKYGNKVTGANIGISSKPFWDNTYREYKNIEKGVDTGVNDFIEGIVTDNFNNTKMANLCEIFGIDKQKFIMTFLLANDRLNNTDDLGEKVRQYFSEKDYEAPTINEAAINNLIQVLVGTGYIYAHGYENPNRGFIGDFRSYSEMADVSNDDFSIKQNNSSSEDPNEEYVDGIHIVYSLYANKFVSAQFTADYLDHEYIFTFTFRNAHEGVFPDRCGFEWKKIK